MTAPDNTTLQANFKLPNGDLINVYGKDAFDFKANLEALADLAAQVASTGDLLRGTQTLAQAGITGTPVQQPQAAPQQATVTQFPQRQAAPSPVCQHGERTRRTGTDKRGAWVGYFCPQPRGQQQCEPIFEDA